MWLFGASRVENAVGHSERQREQSQANYVEQGVLPEAGQQRIARVRHKPHNQKTHARHGERLTALTI
jgi:hypothetical protein